MSIIIEEMRGVPVSEQEVEIVERKGLGHPDSLCDAVMEAISVALSRAYLDAYGMVLHHNIDKGLLVAGRTEKWFGGGRLLQPMQLVIGDRAATGRAGREIPVAEIAVEAARDWLRQHLRYIDTHRDIEFRIALAPGSVELVDLFDRPGAVRGANDTSAAVGYWPLTPVEATVLEFENWLNSKEFKDSFPESGEDVKVMGMRQGRALDLTLAMPLMCPHIANEEEYFARKELIYRELLEWAESRVPFDTAIYFNALDAPGRGLRGVYLSLLGTSAEDADSGQVGRGNRVNGLIPVNRPIGTEAAAGKNPVSHIGKIYQFLAHRIARAVGEKNEEVREVQVFLASRIGLPIDRPALAAVSLCLAPGADFSRLRRRAAAIVEQEIVQVNSLCDRLSRGEWPEGLGPA